MEKREISVSGMSCKHCQKHVHDVIADLEGVQNVEVVLEKGVAVIEFDPSKIKLDAIVSEVNTTHYKASTS